MKFEKILQRLKITPVYLILTLVFWASAHTQASTYRVKSVIEYLDAEDKASPGDTILWETGTFQDMNWVISKDGLVIKAEQPGTSIFRGSSKVEIKASKITFSGFQFIDGKAKDDVCKISGSQNIIEQLNFSNYHSNYYLNVTATAHHNTVRYCNFEKKPEDKQTSVVQIQVDEKQPGYNLVSHCSFKNHTAPPNAGGDYGIEALRIGYSYQSRFISRTIVEYCYFYRCNGDGEIISSKARENVFRYNTFSDNGESHFTLRHGKDNVLYGNFFLRGAGLRIKEGQNQMVYNNYFNTGNQWAIKLENYKADPLKSIVIAHNTFAESGSILLGGKGDFQPTEVLLASNLFYKPTASLIDDSTGLESFSSNAVQDSQSQIPKGFYVSNVKILMNPEGFYQPEDRMSKSKVNSKLQILDIPTLNDDPQITRDIAGNKRPEKEKSAGSFDPGKKSIQMKPYATAENTGPEYLQRKDNLAKQVIENIREETIEKANQLIKEKPVTVTASSCIRSAGKKNDFYSEGDYWWPDPANPTGPYIQKDGQTNPDNFVAHRLAMIRLSEIAATHTSAWILSGDQKYANQVLIHLNAWFVDPATRMNPNMLYAQAIWGRFTGRGIGLIDAYHLVEVIRSVKMLEEKGGLSTDQLKPVKAWFGDFLTWMTTHSYGIDEMNARNNHGTCWVVTAAAMADLTQNKEVRELCIDRFKTVFLPSQMSEDGSFPLELKRTKPYGYSLFNMDAMCNLAEILSTPDDNLWEFQTPDGKSLKKGMEYIYPYITDKSKWPFAKDIYIWDEWPARQSSLLFAGLAYEKEEYIHTFLSLPATFTHPEVIRNVPVRHPIIWLTKIN
ncbi:MAG: alginate lyase family protein [Verrucomicrobia bacterium]|nr:alginate lyase family protein [Prolixibacteraceae bacterium]